MKEKRYLVTLVGGGDSYYKIVDQESWEWIHSPPMSGKGSKLDKNESEFFWKDTSVPQKVLDRILKVAGRREIFVWVNFNSVDNDRALHDPGIECFYTALELHDWLKENEDIYEMCGEYDGIIY